MFWPFNKKPAPAPTQVDIQPLSIQPPSVEEFRQCLTETVAWCAARVSADAPETCLRSAALQSGDLVEPPVMIANPKWWLLPKQRQRKIRSEAKVERQNIVAALAQKRAELLRHEGSFPDEPLHDLAGGRLLVYAPSEQFADGLAELETAGFFDIYNAPAWDTWICYIQDQEQPNSYSGDCRAFLISWVPPAFINLAAEGIFVNPEESIHWLTKFDTTFTQELRRAGLLGE
jgi:hypothetical protein